MKASGVIRSTVPAVLMAMALALAGCETMSSMWGSTKSFFGGGKVTLSGSQEVPPVTTSASGSGSIKVADDKSVSGSVSTSGIAGIAAHIHMGATGQNGPVIVPLKQGPDGTWSVPAGAKLTNAQYEAYKEGNLYVNVHSAAHRGGEIRAQLKP